MLSFRNYITLFILVWSSNTLAIESAKNSSITFLTAIGSNKPIGRIIMNARLIPPHSYFLGIGYRTAELFSTPIQFSCEVMKHFGRQSSYEIVLYPSVESSPLYLNKVGFSWGIGNGISALVGSHPKFEKRKSIKGEVKNPTQTLLNYLIIEQNIFLKDKPEYKLTMRWHHRCTFFGAINSKINGSNFFGLGFRYSF